MLKSYLIFISNFEQALIKENNIQSDENIWNYMVKKNNQKGKIYDYNYTCHGSGFTVEKNGVICEYDRAPLNEYDIKFSFWKFKNFIETNYKHVIINDKILKKDLSDMIAINILNWLIIDGINWNIYQTNLVDNM